MEEGWANPIMKGGEGPRSYVQNSSYQADVMASFKTTIYDAIVNNLEFDKWFSNFSDNGNYFRIADFGCSTGPNTFTAIQYIVEAVQEKYQTTPSELVDVSKALEFQVFFNDQVNNDFNTLFSSLPSSGGQPYIAAGVPGSFHGRLFPKSTLHIACSFSSLHLLSRVPKEVTDINAPAWNKGNIYFAGNNAMVYEAFSTQCKKDLGDFLRSRAEEMTKGGILLLSMIYCLEEYGTYKSKTFCCALNELLGTCLMDLAKMGMISEERVESFNLPLYFTSIPEFRDAIETNGCFSIQKIEACVPPRPNIPTSHLRAVYEQLLARHFGSHIIDHLFELFDSKRDEISTSDFETTFNVFVCLEMKS